MEKGLYRKVLLVSLLCHLMAVPGTLPWVTMKHGKLRGKQANGALSRLGALRQQHLKDTLLLGTLWIVLTCTIPLC